jgi:hypothetical protein
MEIDKYLGGDGVMIEKARKEFGVTEIPVEMPDEIPVAARAAQDMLPVDKRGGFDETELGFDKAAAVSEASRCLHCDFGKYSD